MPKKKEEIFDIPQPPQTEQNVQAKQVEEVEKKKKTRKRKPMTDEQKKAFTEKMRKAREAKAQRLAQEIINKSQVASSSNVEAPKKVVNKPIETIKQTSSQPTSSNMINFDSRHFETLSTHIQQLNNNLINLQNYQTEQAKLRQQKKQQETTAQPQAKQSQEHVKMEVQAKQSQPQPQPKPQAQNVVRQPIERKKVYNVRTKKYVYV